MNLINVIIGVSLFCLMTIGATALFSSDLIRLFNVFRPVLLDGGGKQCISSLRERGVKFRSLGNQGSDTCPVMNAVRVEGFENIVASSPFVLSCPTALKLTNWLQDAQVKSFSHMGTVNCRKMRGSGFLSEHSFGTAIDISMLDGAVVKTDWGKKTEKGRRLIDAAGLACRHFSNVLTPNTNRAHYDHFHFDNGIGLNCQQTLFK
jgi:hypothetical protein